MYVCVLVCVWINVNDIIYIDYFLKYLWTLQHILVLFLSKTLHNTFLPEKFSYTVQVNSGCFHRYNFQCLTIFQHILFRFFFAFSKNLIDMITIQMQISYPHNQILIFLLDVVTLVEVSSKEYTPAHLFKLVLTSLGVLYQQTV